ncbi:porin family protein [Bacteroidota bacterium]
MKKLSTLIFIVFITLNSYSQSDEFIPVYSFGVKQGLNYSSVSFAPSLKQGLTFGYTGGLVYKYQNEKLFAIQLELNYIQKGWTEDLDTINNSYSRTLNYIELPLITQIVLGKRPKLKYYVNLGTSFAYLVSESESLEVNDELYRREYYEKEVENKFDYSALGELGLSFNTGIGEFQIGVRYQITLTDLFKGTTETIYDNSHNQLWNLSLSYFFFDNKD